MKILLLLASLLPLAAALRNNCPEELSPARPVWQSTLPSEWTAAQVGLFPERISIFDEARHPLGPSVLAESVPASVRFQQKSYMNITFFHEGAGYRNQFGIYDVDTDEQTLLFPDLSFWRPGCMETGDTITVGPFEAGSHIGFFLTANGYNGGSDTWYTDREKNSDGYPHVVTVLDTEFQVLLIGVEDLRNLGDEDFNDALFMATILETQDDGQGGEEVGDQADMDEAIFTSDLIVSEGGTMVTCRDASAPEDDSLVVSPTGTAYSVLDGRSLTDGRYSGQVGKWRIPANWAVASDTRTLRSEIPAHNWGASCVAFRDGVALGLDLSPCADPQLTGDGLEAGDCVATETGGNSVIITRSLLEDNLPELENKEDFGGACTVTDNLDAPAGLPEYSRKTYTCVGNGEGDVGVRFGLDGLSDEASKYGFRVCADISTEDVSGVHNPTSDEVVGLYCDIEHDDESFTYGIQGRTNTGTHDFEGVCVDLDPTLHSSGSEITTAGIHLLIRNKTGTVTFKNVVTEQRDGNLVENPDARVVGDSDYQGQEAYGWNSFGEGYDIETTDDEYGQCMRMQSSGGSEVYGAEQIITFSSPVSARGLYIGAAAKGSVAGLSDLFYSVYADVYFTDGTTMFGINVPFPTSSDELVYQDKVVFFNTEGTAKTVDRINVLAVFAGHEGSVCVSDINLRLISYEGNGQIVGGPRAHGDPHYQSLTGYTFDVQTVGEFLVYEDSEFSMQIRHGASGNAAIATAVAIGFHGSTFSLVTSDGNVDPNIFVNRGAISLADGHVSTALAGDEDYTNGFSVRRSGASAGQEEEMGIPLRYIFSGRRDNGEEYRVVISVFVSEFDVQYLTVALEATAASLKSSATGLFLLTEDEVEAAANGRLRQSDVDDVVHRVIAPNYLVTEDTSVFKYTDEFSTLNNISGPDDVYDASSTDRYLETAATLLDDAEAYVAAEQACHKTTGKTKDECITDILLTGDLSFAASYAEASGSDAAIDPAVVANLVDTNDSDEKTADSASSLTASLLLISLSLAMTML